jgi:tetratricopeptide (TPR) repeat protein
MGLVSCSRDPVDMSREGLRLLEEGNASAAHRSFTRALQKMEGQPGAGALWNAVGVSAARMGEEEEAETAFRNAWSVNPEGWAAHANAGILFRDQQRWTEAEAAFTRAARLAPDPSLILEFRAVDAMRNGDTAQAMQWLQEAVRQNPTSENLSSLAVVSVNLLPMEERRSLLLRAVSLDPLNSSAQLNLAAFLDQHRFDPELARTHYEAFMRLSPESPFVPQVQQRLHVLDVRYQSGERTQPDPVREEVEALLNQAAEAESERQSLMYCLRAHSVAARANRLDLRERSLRAATALVPSSPRAFVGLGRCLAEQGKDQEARSAFAEAFRLAPTWGPAWEGFVEILVRLGQMDEVMQILGQVEAAAQDQPEVLLAVGESFSQLSNGARRASRIFSRILQEFPESEAARELTERSEP